MDWVAYTKHLQDLTTLCIVYVGACNHKVQITDWQCVLIGRWQAPFLDTNKQTLYTMSQILKTGLKSNNFESLVHCLMGRIKHQCNKLSDLSLYNVYWSD